MDTIYLKIKIRKSDTDFERIRDEGLLFETISDILNIERDAIIEIDENNYNKEVKKIISKYRKYD